MTQKTHHATVIRAADGGKPVPDDVRKARAEARETLS